MARFLTAAGRPRTSAEEPASDKLETFLRTFHAQLRNRALKSTGQRDDIAQVFFELGRHVSAEELYAEVRKVNPHVGYATIYRTLRLLKECDLVFERHFADGQARYEIASGRHHDHFICDFCSKIIEFRNEALEELQAKVAMELGVELTHHKMELYGRCADCRRAAER
jgi:Fur family ferric uptake transcriptional regulator